MLLVLFRSSDDGKEIRDIKRGATNQSAVNVWLSKKFIRVARLATAPVKDSAILGSRCIESPCEPIANERVHFLGLCEEAVLPVPMAQMGSYAMTTPSIASFDRPSNA